MALEITAVSLGSVLALPKPALLCMCGYGETQDIPLIMFVIRGGGAPIIVDTGADAERAGPLHGMQMRQAAHERPAAALRQLGIDPDEVPIVVNTHLHWDHCSSNDLFPNARVMVQRRELDYAPRPVRWHSLTYEAGLSVEPAWTRVRHQLHPRRRRRRDRARRVGRRAARAPPGSQGVLVEGAVRRYLIAGDCVYGYANWCGDEHANHLPAGHYTDVIEYETSFDRIEALHCEVVPSHDFAVLERRVFA